MQKKSCILAILLVLPLCSWAKQNPSQWDKYQPRTIASIVEANQEALKESFSSPEDQNKQQLFLTSDSFPSRVSLTYEGKSRPLPAPQQKLIKAWAKMMGRSEDVTQKFPSEYLFKEDGAERWIAVQEPLLLPLPKEVKPGHKFIAYIIWMGTIKVNDHWEWLFAMNEFDAPQPTK